MPIPTNLRIDGNRLLWRLETLAKIGDTGDGGCRRLALSDEDREGRDLLVSWMRRLVGMVIAPSCGVNHAKSSRKPRHAAIRDPSSWRRSYGSRVFAALRPG